MDKITNPPVMILEGKGHKVQQSTSMAEKKLKEACKGFESLFIHEILKSMRKTIPKSGLLDGGMQERIYESMFDEAVSKALSERGALGIADMLYKEFGPHIVRPVGGER